MQLYQSGQWVAIFGSVFSQLWTRLNLTLHSSTLSWPVFDLIHRELCLIRACNAPVTSLRSVDILEQNTVRIICYLFLYRSENISFFMHHCRYVICYSFNIRRCPIVGARVSSRKHSLLFRTLASAYNDTALTENNGLNVGRSRRNWIGFVNTFVSLATRWKHTYRWGGGIKGTVGEGKGALTEASPVTNRMSMRL